MSAPGELLPAGGTHLDPRVWQFWGKADPKRMGSGPDWHPLLCHVLDVVACARRLLLDVYPERLTTIADALALSREDTLAWLSFAVALHDLGKATPPFQAKVPARAEALRGLGLDFPADDEPHGPLSAILVPAELERFGCPRRLALALAAAVGAHHGEFARTERLLNLEDDPDQHAGRAPLWKTLRGELVDALAGTTGVTRASPPRVPARGAVRQAVIADLAGLTTVADWVGSNADIFGYVDPPATAAEYMTRALELATNALQLAGFRRAPRPHPRSFEALFGRAPWPLHDAVLGVLSQVEPGSLVVVEAPMGEGKTEAALLLYDTLAGRGSHGLYFALPTQATANQILGRVERYLAHSFPGESHGLHLVHGGAGLSDRYGELKRRAVSTRSVGDVARSEADQGPIADAWFVRPKRALLAPIAVGTVDQALLGVLRSKHHFLRLHGLAGKVFVVDEVHAYDTFTAEILARLCRWLRALGSTVVLLSATLASPQRARLLAAYGVDATPTPTPYPRITVAHDGHATASTFRTRRPPVEVKIEWKNEVGLVRAVLEAIAKGGCVAWIVNTVARAQTTYQVFAEMRARGDLAADVEISLLHARFPFVQRQARERAAEEAFGPPERAPRRPRAAVLIGTQVLEQSLDLDFDLMVTDLAPVDLVLQRAGRLHRHDRERRPRGLESPRLWIAFPESPDAPSGPTFGSSTYVYDESILLRSWLSLAGRTSVVLPTDIEPLVESVYAPVLDAAIADPIAVRLAELDAALSNEQRSEAANADRRELPGPDESDPFRDFSARYDEEDPRIHDEIRAITRLGEATVTVVPVESRAGRLFLSGDRSREIDVHREELSIDDALAMARQTITIGRRAVVTALTSDRPPTCFQRSGYLRHHRLLPLDEAGESVVGGTRLRLDPALGLVVGDLHPFADPT
jgi:CRISPR-associated endonuclease/helicase Cas3